MRSTHLLLLLCILFFPCRGHAAIDVYTTSLNQFVDAYTTEHGESTAAVVDACSQYLEALQAELGRLDGKLQQRFAKIPKVLKAYKKFHASYMAVLEPKAEFSLLVEIADFETGETHWGTMYTSWPITAQARGVWHLVKAYKAYLDAPDEGGAPFADLLGADIGGR